MKKLIHMRFYFVLLIFFSSLLFSFRSTNTISKTADLNATDTTTFSANAAEGWITHTSYLVNLTDSVEFELILFRTVPAGNNWNNISEAGTIREEFRPSVERVFEYYEHPRTWKITVRTNGKCFFQLLSGPALAGENIVLPILTKYKK